jgi:hypothetical protein
MRFYYEIKSGTEAYEVVKHDRECGLQWINKTVTKAIASFLGIDDPKMIDDLHLGCVTHNLFMKNVPEHLKSQFKKNRMLNGFYAAKKSLKLKWIIFCKEQGLQNPDFWGALYGKFDWAEGNGKLAWVMCDRYFIESGSDICYAKWRFLTPITEKEFLQAKIDALNAQEAKKNQQVS